MTATLKYTISYVEDMDKSVKFYVDILGLSLRFSSPQWSEFDTGPTTMALHIASDERPAGTCQLGFDLDDLTAFHATAMSAGVTFTVPPTMLHGRRIAKFRDLNGAEVSVSGPSPADPR